MYLFFPIAVTSNGSTNNKLLASEQLDETGFHKNSTMLNSSIKSSSQTMSAVMQSSFDKTHSSALSNYVSNKYNKKSE
jgi:hypothetical protein